LIEAHVFSTLRLERSAHFSASDENARGQPLSVQQARNVGAHTHDL